MTPPKKAEGSLVSEFPLVTQHLVDSLRRLYPDTCKNLVDIEGLLRAKAHQEIIDKLEEISKNQVASKTKRGT